MIPTGLSYFSDGFLMGKSSNYMGYQPTIAMLVEGICAEKLQQLLRCSFFINTAACFRCPDPDFPWNIGIIGFFSKRS